MKKINLILAILIGLMLAQTQVTIAKNSSAGVLPPNSNAYGKSLAEWSEIYWRWWVLCPWVLCPSEQPLNTGIGRVNLMPLPFSEQTGGDWSPENPAYFEGKIEVDLAPGTPFVLPFFAWIAEIYENGDRDPMIPDDSIQSMVTNIQGDGSPEVTLDEKPIVSNFWDYYVGPVEFDPLVVYPEPSSYGSIAAWAFQGVTIVVAPLNPGKHELKLLEKWVLPDSRALIYDNTWIINVKR
jgi:hypothetical protein